MSYTFLRWVRTGVAASLEGQPAVGTPARPRLEVGVDLSARVASGQLPGTIAWAALDVLGPADVTGIDRRQVIRTFPVDGALDAEPAYLAHVEFDRPDLPWMFTPHGPAPDGTLRPWLCLVVVRVGPDALLDPALPLPRLTVSGAEVAELPDLTETAAWAHVQAVGDVSGGIERLVSGAPERVLSRLLCPRQLTAGTAYLACVVPTVKAGALAGLGRGVPEGTPLDAWSAGDAVVELPVYFHWEFTAGSAGDFRSLVTRLQPRDELPGIGTRDLDVSTPGFSLPDRDPAVTVPLGGALRVAEPAAAPVDPTLAAQLGPLVSTDAVAPPVYGRWHAGRRDVRVPATGPLPWLDALNLDPRHRVAAGLGTLVVQQRQEDLMAAIWDQLDAVMAANQLLRQAQLGVAAAEHVVARHLDPLGDLVLLSVAGPALARIAVSPGLTARGAVARSCLPVLAVCGGSGIRRLLRGRGPLQRRYARGRVSFPDLLPPPAIDRAQVLSDLASGALDPPSPGLPGGAVGLPPAPAGVDPLGAVRSDFTRLAERVPDAACDPLPTTQVAGATRSALTPSTSIGARVKARIDLPTGPVTPITDRLDPILAAPVVDTPMIGPLQELGLEWLLPGLADLPRDTIGVVEPEPAFVEAYLVGLNHEIGREMLWRGFPTDQRGTVFARFWDRRGAVPTAQAPVPETDIAPIHSWSAVSVLGDHLGAGTQGLLVLLVRGDLLQRYPRATVYLRQGRWRRDKTGVIVLDDAGLAGRERVPLPDAAAWDAHTRFPVFSRRVGADVSLLGFPLDRDTIRGLDRTGVPPGATDEQAGWYVVFQEQPTEPRFGLGPALPAPADRRSDALAATLLRPAFRLFVHASDLVPA